MGLEQKKPNPLAALRGDHVGQAAGTRRAAHLSSCGRHTRDGAVPSDCVAGPHSAIASSANLSRSLTLAQQAIVQPILLHRFAVAAFALSQLVLMVRKNEVQPAAVNVKSVA